MPVDTALPPEWAAVIQSVVQLLSHTFGFQSFNKKETKQHTEWIPATSAVASHHLTHLLQDKLVSRDFRASGVWVANQPAVVLALSEIHATIFKPYRHWCKVVQLEADLNSIWHDEAAWMPAVAELSLFMLIYTEAANVRLMPEVMHFIFWLLSHSHNYQEVLSLRLCPANHGLHPAYWLDHFGAKMSLPGGIWPRYGGDMIAVQAKLRRSCAELIAQLRAKLGHMPTFKGLMELAAAGPHIVGHSLSDPSSPMRKPSLSTAAAPGAAFGPGRGTAAFTITADTQQPEDAHDAAKARLGGAGVGGGPALALLPAVLALVSEHRATFLHVLDTCKPIEQRMDLMAVLRSDTELYTVFAVMVVMGDGGLYMDKVIQPIFCFLAEQIDYMGGICKEEASARIGYDDCNESLCVPDIVHKALTALGVKEGADPWSALLAIGNMPYGMSHNRAAMTDALLGILEHSYPRAAKLIKHEAAINDLLPLEMLRHKAHAMMAANWWRTNVFQKTFVEKRSVSQILRSFFRVYTFHFVAIHIMCAMGWSLPPLSNQIWYASMAVFTHCMLCCLYHLLSMFLELPSRVRRTAIVRRQGYRALTSQYSSRNDKEQQLGRISIEPAKSGEAEWQKIQMDCTPAACPSIYRAARIHALATLTYLAMLGALAWSFTTSMEVTWLPASWRPVLGQYGLDSVWAVATTLYTALAVLWLVARHASGFGYSWRNVWDLLASRRSSADFYFSYSDVFIPRSRYFFTVLLWMATLTLKFSFDWFGLVMPLKDPLKKVFNRDAIAASGFGWDTTLNLFVSAMQAVPALLIALFDTGLFFNLMSAMASVVYGYCRLRAGHVRTWEHMVSGFHAAPQLFWDKCISTRGKMNIRSSMLKVNDGRNTTSTQDDDEIKMEAQKRARVEDLAPWLAWVTAWNEVVMELRDRDMVSHTQLDNLAFQQLLLAPMRAANDGDDAATTLQGPSSMRSYNLNGGEPERPAPTREHQTDGGAAMSYIADAASIMNGDVAELLKYQDGASMIGDSEGGAGPGGLHGMGGMYDSFNSVSPPSFVVRGLEEGGEQYYGIAPPSPRRPPQLQLDLTARDVRVSPPSPSSLSGPVNDGNSSPPPRMNVFRAGPLSPQPAAYDSAGSSDEPEEGAILLLRPPPVLAASRLRHASQPGVPSVEVGAGTGRMMQQALAFLDANNEDAAAQTAEAPRSPAALLPGVPGAGSLAELPLTIRSPRTRALAPPSGGALGPPPAPRNARRSSYCVPGTADSSLGGPQLQRLSSFPPHRAEPPTDFRRTPAANPEPASEGPTSIFKAGYRSSVTGMNPRSFSRLLSTNARGQMSFSAGPGLASTTLLQSAALLMGDDEDTHDAQDDSSTFIGGGGRFEDWDAVMSSKSNAEKAPWRRATGAPGYLRRLRHLGIKPYLLPRFIAVGQIPKLVRSGTATDSSVAVLKEAFKLLLLWLWEVRILNKDQIDILLEFEPAYHPVNQRHQQHREQLLQKILELLAFKGKGGRDFALSSLSTSFTHAVRAFSAVAGGGVGGGDTSTVVGAIGRHSGLSATTDEIEADADIAALHDYAAELHEVGTPSLRTMAQAMPAGVEMPRGMDHLAADSAAASFSEPFASPPRAGGAGRGALGLGLRTASPHGRGAAAPAPMRRQIRIGGVNMYEVSESGRSDLGSIAENSAENSQASSSNLGEPSVANVRVLQPPQPQSPRSPRGPAHRGSEADDSFSAASILYPHRLSRSSGSRRARDGVGSFASLRTESSSPTSPGSHNPPPREEVPDACRLWAQLMVDLHRFYCSHLLEIVKHLQPEVRHSPKAAMASAAGTEDMDSGQTHMQQVTRVLEELAQECLQGLQFRDDDEAGDSDGDDSSSADGRVSRNLDASMSGIMGEGGGGGGGGGGGIKAARPNEGFLQLLLRLEYGYRRVLTDTVALGLYEQILAWLLDILTQSQASTEPDSVAAQRELTHFMSTLFDGTMDAPPQVHQMRSITTLTPHYEEDVIYALCPQDAALAVGIDPASNTARPSGTDMKSFLFQAEGNPTQLMEYLKTVYPKEWDNFMERLKELAAGMDIDASAVTAEDFLPGRPLYPLRLELLMWASCRGQLLGRTVRGMMSYRTALQVLTHMEAGSSTSVPELVRREAQAAMVDGKYSYVVTSQLYGNSVHNQRDLRKLWLSKGLDILMDMYPNMRVAHLATQNIFSTGHAFPDLRYELFQQCSVLARGAAHPDTGMEAPPALTSAMLDLSIGLSGSHDRGGGNKHSQALGSVGLAAQPQEVYRIRLPINYEATGSGFKLGEGKPENQNHAMIFCFGQLLQTIDMNQDNNLAEALRLRHAVDEFEPSWVRGRRIQEAASYRRRRNWASMASMATFNGRASAHRHSTANGATVERSGSSATSTTTTVSPPQGASGRGSFEIPLPRLRGRTSLTGGDGLSLGGEESPEGFSRGRASSSGEGAHAYVVPRGAGVKAVDTPQFRPRRSGSNSSIFLTLMRNTLSRPGSYDGGGGSYDGGGGLLAPNVPVSREEEARRRDEKEVAIVGFPEWIFSQDFGAVAEFAASTELTFGTTMQRAMWLFGSTRFHYGHPDIWNKLFVMTRGGVSKANRSLHVSEDVFGGYNAVLRGADVKFIEYMSVGKARDVGLDSVNGFEAKISQGNGEQVMSREVNRLGGRFDFFRLMTFYHTGPGFFVNQYLATTCIYVSIYVLVLLGLTAADSSALDLTVSGSVQILQLGSISMIAFFITAWLHEGPINAVRIMAKQLLAGTMMFSIIRTRTTAHHFSSNVAHGGASYIATGRGFALETRSFVDMYRLYAHSHFYFAADLLLLVIMSLVVSAPAPPAHSWPTWSVVFSLLLGPFWFNPFAFDLTKITQDYKSFIMWVKDRSRGDGTAKEYWREWKRGQLHRQRNGSGTQSGRGVLTVCAILGQAPSLLLCFLAMLKMRFQDSYDAWLFLVSLVLLVFLAMLVAATERRFTGASLAITWRYISTATIFTLIGAGSAFIYFFIVGNDNRIRSGLILLYTAMQCVGMLNVVLTYLFPRSMKARHIVESLHRAGDCVLGLLLLACLSLLSLFGLVTKIQGVLLFNTQYTKQYMLKQQIRGTDLEAAMRKLKALPNGG